MSQTIMSPVSTPEMKAKTRLRILSISSVFPNPREPQHGVFVRSRLQALANWADITVVAPVPVFDYARNARSGEIPARRSDGPLEVLHPRWIYPPFGTAVNVFLLAAQLRSTVRRVIDTRGADIIDAHFGYPEGIASALLARAFNLPLVITLRGNETMHARHAARRYLMAWMLRRADLVIAVSNGLRRFAISCGTPENRIINIPNGIDGSLFKPYDRREIRAGLGIEPDTRVILSAGSLIERKGHHRVVDEVARLLRRGTDVRLIIAGGAGREGEFETKLRRQVQSAGISERVTFTGHVDPATLSQFMSAADLLCLASSREGWPNVVHEALACGTPVVATDVGAVKEMLPVEEFGIVVPVGDGSALGAALEKSLERTWNRARISAYGHSRNWDQVASEVLHGMHHIVGNRGQE